MTKKKGPTHFFSNIEPRGRRRRETTNNMEDAFARSIGEVESHFDFDDGVSLFIFRFSVFEGGFWCWRCRSKAFDRRRRRRMISMRDFD